MLTAGIQACCCASHEHLHPRTLSEAFHVQDATAARDPGRTRLDDERPGVRRHFEARSALANNRPALEEILHEMAGHAWTREAIGALLKSTAAKHGLKPPQVMMPLRVLVAGTPQTPAIDAVLALLGRDRARSRIAAGLAVTPGR